MVVTTRFASGSACDHNLHGAAFPICPSHLATCGGRPRRSSRASSSRPIGLELSSSLFDHRWSFMVGGSRGLSPLRDAVCIRPIHLTFGRRSWRLHQHPACGGCSHKGSASMSRCAGTDERGLQHYARSIEAIVGQMLRSEGTSSGLNDFSHITPIAGHSSVCHKKLVCAIVLLMGSASALKAETVPLPRERPPVLEDQTSASKIESERSACQLQLSEIAEFKSVPPITGPGECTATDVVNLSAVLLPDNHRVVFSPIVTLQMFDGKGGRAVDPRRCSADARYVWYVVARR